MLLGAEMDSGVPVPMDVPPHESLNHLSVVPDPPVAVRLMLA